MPFFGCCRSSLSQAKRQWTTCCLPLVTVMGTLPACAGRC
jgi:hypothetical protein